MSEILGGDVPTEHNERVVDPATATAWEARSYLLQFSASDPESEQAKQAKRKADDAFTELYDLTSPALLADIWQTDKGRPRGSCRYSSGNIQGSISWFTIIQRRRQRQNMANKNHVQSIGQSLQKTSKAATKHGYSF